jgi:uncharacterized membrane protein YfbV (UPF0208 family)
MRYRITITCSQASHFLPITVLITLVLQVIVSYHVSISINIIVPIIIIVLVFRGRIFWIDTGSSMNR